MSGRKIWTLAALQHLSHFLELPLRYTWLWPLHSIICFKI